MRKKKETTQVVYEDQAIICNKCGKEVDLEKANDFEENLFHSFKVSFGYGSKYDLELWSFDLCEDCLLEFIDTFKIKPDRREYELK